TSAQQGSRISSFEWSWTCDEATGRCDHGFGIAAVDMDSEHRLLPTVHEVAAATRAAGATIRAEKADPDAIADLPVLNTLTQCVDRPDDFMAGNARKSEPGELSPERQV